MVATVTARRLAEPLSGVADRAARLGAGDFRAAPRRHGIPELDRVSDVLDTSAAALSELVQRERELVGDVSHQLRSRITALQLRLDELASHPDPDARREAMAALEQTEKLSAVLDDLLEAARAARAAGAELMDLREVLVPVVEEWRPNLRAEGRALKVRLPDGLLARVTPARIREAVGALVDNALRHGEGAVTLTARAVEGSLVIEVADGGRGRAGGPGAARLRPRRVRRLVHRARAGAGACARRGRRRAAGALPHAARAVHDLPARGAGRRRGGRPADRRGARASREGTWRRTSLCGNTNRRNAHHRNAIPTSVPTICPLTKSAISWVNSDTPGTFRSST